MGWGDVRYYFAMAILVIILILIILLPRIFVRSIFRRCPILLAYLVPLDVDVTGNTTAKLCEL
jgi:lauroyl/myristoyl acyltransferase